MPEGCLLQVTRPSRVAAAPAVGPLASYGSDPCRTACGGAARIRVHLLRDLTATSEQQEPVTGAGRAAMTRPHLAVAQKSAPETDG